MGFIKKQVKDKVRKAFSDQIKKLEEGYNFVELGDEYFVNTKVLSNRERLLEYMPKNGVVAELGVNEGDFSEKILSTTNPKKLHLIDVWASKRYHEGLYSSVKKRFSSQIESNLVEINRGLSIEAVNSFSDNYFDWIYIDTDHSYSTTKAELELYAPKMKEGGIIAGHDFSRGSWYNIVRYGVIEAVYEFCEKNKWEVLYLSMENKGSKSFAIRKMK